MYETPKFVFEYKLIILNDFSCIYGSYVYVYHGLEISFNWLEEPIIKIEYFTLTSKTLIQVL